MPDQPRRTVKDLLAESKDTSELMVDLAYAAVFFADEKLADEVDRLEETMGEHLAGLRRISMLAARSPEDAEAMSDVLHVASCIEKIGDAAVDIARVVSAHLGIPDALRADLRHADEVVGRVRVRESSSLVGQALGEIGLPTETGMWVMAVRRGTEWEFDPGPDTTLTEDDVLLYRGPVDGVRLMLEVAGAPPADPVSAPDVPALNDLDRAVDLLVEMKNAAEVTVGLAYSALLFGEPALAAEVATLETRSDELQAQLESWVLRAAQEARDPDDLRGLFRLAYASEAIFDAARDMTRVVEHGEVLHPVVAEAISASDAVAADAVVDAGAPADGRSLKELSFKTQTGMFVLAVQRDRRWIYRPGPRFELRSGDRLITVGPEDGIEELDALTGTRANASAR